MKRVTVEPLTIERKHWEIELEKCKIDKVLLLTFNIIGSEPVVIFFIINFLDWYLGINFCIE